MAHTPKFDCVMCRYDYISGKGFCIGLTEMMCVTRGECKFYKTPEQLEEQQRKCRMRIASLQRKGIRVPNARRT